jgi:hypothetical protein
MNFDIEAERRKVLDMMSVIQAVPKVSVMYSVDEMFRSYIHIFNQYELKAIENFFEVYEKYNILTDDLKIKREIYREVKEDIKYRNIMKNKPYYPNRISGFKKHAEPQKYSRKELGSHLRKYSYILYRQIRKRKFEEDDFNYFMGDMLKNNFDKISEFFNKGLAK